VLNDLIVLGPSFAAEPAKDDLTTLVACCDRPLLIVPDEPNALDSLLLVYDGSRKSDTALFIATYCAELWKSRFVAILPNSTRHGDKRASGESAFDHLNDYLAIHEVEPVIVMTPALNAEDVVRTATEYDCQIIIWGETVSKNRPTLLRGIVERWSRPFLVC
jgi:hypothetical protein